MSILSPHTKPEWKAAIKPAGLAWDETPIDFANLAPDKRGYASYAPTSNVVSVLVAADVSVDRLPSDLIGAVLALANAGQHPAGVRGAALDFASKFGPLGIARRFVLVEGQEVSGESIAEWAEETHAFMEALVLLQHLRLLKGPRKRSWFAPLIAMPAVAFEIGEKWTAAYEPLTADEHEKTRCARADRAARVVRTARAQAINDATRDRLLTLVNEGLTRSGARLELRVVDNTFQLVNAAPRLLAQLWQRVALAATQRTELSACENCGELLVPDGQRKRDKMRSDRKTCGRRCRQALAAKRKARTEGGRNGKAR
jgi:hypothetical protein